jgi:hypothetical protein
MGDGGQTVAPTAQPDADEPQAQGSPLTPWLIGGGIILLLLVAGGIFLAIVLTRSSRRKTTELGGNHGR